MVKKWTVLLVFTGLVNCSGYLSEYPAGQDDQAYSLAIQNGGGYLSGPSNDITPFVYRDIQGQNPVLFFSSDRDGSYDIYYARLNSDGSFQPPVKMNSNVNSQLSNEYAPVVAHIFDPMDNFTYQPKTNFMLLFVRAIGTTYRVFSHMLTNDFESLTWTYYFNYPYPIRALGTFGNDIYRRIWVLDGQGSTNTEANYSFSTWNTFTQRRFLVPEALAAYGLIQTNQGFALYKVLEVSNSGKSQIMLSIIQTNQDNSLNNSANYISEYASIYNDRWPFIDRGALGEVYFSSDRGINGDYDLFRYNELNFHRVVPQNPFK